MQASHYAITAHRLVVLAEVNTMSQNWGYLFFKLSLAETLEEVATSITEEAWLYNEYAFYICFYYIHCFCFNFCSLIRSSKIIPSFFTIKEGVFSTSPSLLQGELHFLPKPLFLRKRGCNRPPVLRTATL